jgi:hypothetical protein
LVLQQADRAEAEIRMPERTAEHQHRRTIAADDVSPGDALMHELPRRVRCPESRQSIVEWGDRQHRRAPASFDV